MRARPSAIFVACAAIGCSNAPTRGTAQAITESDAGEPEFGTNGDAGGAGQCASVSSEGTACGDSGEDYCNNGICGPWVVGAHALPQFTALPTGVGVIANPQIVDVTFDSDPLQAQDIAFVNWAGPVWLPMVGTEYGVGVATVQDVQLSSDPPAPTFAATPGEAYSRQDLEAFLAAQITGGALPPPQANTIYVVYLPNFDATGFTSGACVTQGSYHESFNIDPSTQVIYAAVPACNAPLPFYSTLLQFSEINSAHEIFEAATDPGITATTGGTTYYPPSSGPTEVWRFLGGELADYCERSTIYYTDPTTGFQAPTVWSNVAAAAGGSTPPCVIWPANQAYMDVGSSPANPIQLTAGQTTASVMLRGWSTLPHAAWTLGVRDNLAASGGFAGNPKLSSNTITNGGQVTLTITVPPNLPTGSADVMWITSFDDQIGEYTGVWLVEFDAP